MSKTYIPKALRRKVYAQGRARCGYCLTQEDNTGAELDVDHIIPEAAGGETKEANLWLACTKCNEYKGDQFEAPDPQSGEIVPLFNPRTQEWSAHFAWTPEKDIIVGQTTIGRATVVALKLNRDSLVRARRRWVTVGWHPPKD